MRKSLKVAEGKNGLKKLAGGGRRQPRDGRRQKDELMANESKQIGTNKYRTEIDSRLLVSFCCANSVVLHLFLVNYGNLGRKTPPFG
jgi:hypothetical protein